MKFTDFFKGVTEIEVSGPKVIWQTEIFGLPFSFTESILLSWVIIAAVTILLLWMTHDMKTKAVTKRQVVAEWAVETIHNLVDDTMGKGNRKFAPYIGALFTFSILGSLLSLFGLRSVTADFSVVFAWALVTFVWVHATKLRTNGLWGYLKGYASPVFVMLPMNVLSEVFLPISMSVRHFGNVASGAIITTLVYFALTSITKAIGVAFMTIGIPAVLSLYFDLFSSFMQAFIFIMLTMVNVASAAEAD